MKKSLGTGTGGDAVRGSAGGRSEQAEDGSPSPADGSDAASAAADARLAAALAAHGVPPAERLDHGCVRFRGVPMAPGFSKPRANVLLRQVPRGQPGAGTVQAFVDDDLAYAGADGACVDVLGPVRGNGWRSVLLPPMAEPFPLAFCRILEVLRSPLAADVRKALGADAPRRADGRLTPFLAAVGEVVPEDDVRRAYETSIRRALADELAAAMTRLAVPRSAILWGPSGVGRRHLMLAACWPLLRIGRATQVVQVSAARIAAGGVFAADVDAAIGQFISEAVAAEGTALVVRDLDLAVTGSGVGYSLLAEGLDAGLAMVATASSESALARLRSVPCLARRLWAVRMRRPTRQEVMAALEHFAAASPVPVEPAAMQTAWAVTHKAGGEQPAAAIAVLAAAAARAAWRGGGARVDPDDVLAVPPGEWPEETWQKG